MANTYPRCQFSRGISTGFPVAVYDRTAENNNIIIVNASTIGGEESIQAQVTDVNQLLQ
jgi:hypothetical protein